MSGQYVFQAVCRAALFLGVCMPATTSAETIRLAVITESATHWPVYIAQAKGTFEKEGLTVQMTVTGPTAAPHQTPLRPMDQEKMKHSFH